jgi:DNA polymerase III subunit tau-like protein
MKSKSHHTGAWNGEETNLLLFPGESLSRIEPSPLAHDPSAPESFLAQSSPLTLTQITAEWQTLLKRLGRRHRVLETILTVSRPIRLIDHTLVLGFPPHRRFHQELLDMPDYRACVEAELARTFQVRLSIVTTLHPERPGLHRRGMFDTTPA